MGRPPCCDKEAVKKGPWTPEEDLVLVSYVREHGPGSWRAVPGATGLARCSKSCRLRWTNYLRPGIRRGGFSAQEDRLIAHLQALLGNRWAAIASYLPDRTDNDVKNYWNTNLRKRLLLLGPAGGGTGTGSVPQQQQQPAKSSKSKSIDTTSNKGKWELRLQTDIDLARRALREALAAGPPLPGTTTATNPAATLLPEEHAPPPPPSCNVSVMLDGWAAESASSSELTDCSSASNGNAAVAVKQQHADDVPLSAIESWLLGDNDAGELQHHQLLEAQEEELLLDAALHSFAAF